MVRVVRLITFRGRVAALPIGRMDLVQQLLDAVLSRDRVIVLERELRHPLQPQTRTDLTAQKRGCTFERARAVLPRVVVAEHGVEHPCQLNIGAHLDARERHEPNARIVHLSCEQLCQLTSDLIGDALRPRTLGHNDKGGWGL